MKLKTTMIDAGNGKRFAESRDGADIDHDAAAAHALMQAMDGLWGLGPEAVASRSGSEIMREIMKDADSLMRSWGFDSGEVE